jgi:hypothetical protein
VPNKTIAVKINGLKHDLPAAETISYERLCGLAVQPPEYNPSVMYTLTPRGKKEILKPGEEAPLVEGAMYGVMLRSAK